MTTTSGQTRTTTSGELDGVPTAAAGDGAAAPAVRTERVTLAKAITLGLRTALEHDPSVLLMGEDIGKLGGVFRVTDGL